MTAEQRIQSTPVPKHLTLLTRDDISIAIFGHKCLSRKSIKTPADNRNTCEFESRIATRETSKTFAYQVSRTRKHYWLFGERFAEPPLDLNPISL